MKVAGRRKPFCYHRGHMSMHCVRTWTPLHDQSLSYTEQHLGILGMEPQSPAQENARNLWVKILARLLQRARLVNLQNQLLKGATNEYCLEALFPSHLDDWHFTAHRRVARTCLASSFIQVSPAAQKTQGGISIIWQAGFLLFVNRLSHPTFSSDLPNMDFK